MKESSKEGKLFQAIKRNAKKFLRFRLILPGRLSRWLFKERLIRRNAWEYLKSKLYYENLMRYRCRELGKNFMLFGQLPYITGNGNIFIGDNVEVNDKVVLFTGGSVYPEPELRIGDNCVLGFMVQIRVAQQVLIGKNCMIANGVRISDNDGHPLYSQRREKELKLSPEQVKPVIIEDDVWIGEDSIILKGVKIGKGSIIGAGSVVRKSVLPMSIVAGNPATVVGFVPPPETG